MNSPGGTNSAPLSRARRRALQRVPHQRFHLPHIFDCHESVARRPHDDRSAHFRQRFQNQIAGSIGTLPRFECIEHVPAI
jgi:hypothetical protein